VFDYNILCNAYANSVSSDYVPSWALDWNYRKEIIVQEILQSNADIICLQEVELEQYEELFLPTLQSHGYDGAFLIKTRAKTMSEAERKVVDGCATFYKRAKFSLEQVYRVEFGPLAMNRIQKSDVLYNRVMNRDNVALLCRFSSREYGNLLVGNVHIHWDPAFKDVKLIQAALLVEQLNAVREAYPQIPIVLTGDFNSVPQSGVYEMLSGGSLAPQHEDFCTYIYEPFYSEGLKHGLCLQDVYMSMDPTIEYSAARTVTNCTPRYEGVIDYIWYSENSLVPSGIYGLLPKEYLGRLIGGLPNAHLPSDHLPLMAEFRLLSGSGAPRINLANSMHSMKL
jgi:CCR4-NOT transcription complex subunit 6